MQSEGELEEEKASYAWAIVRVVCGVDCKVKVDCEVDCSLTHSLLHTKISAVRLHCIVGPKSVL
jgi:hypothetical protein